MNQEFLANLPPEIIIDILSRLPILTIISCKCVCKSWLNLLNSQEFVRSHLSRSPPGLVSFQSGEGKELLMLLEFKDDLEPEHHEFHYKPITKFDLNEFIVPLSGVGIQGSANGLLFLGQVCGEPDPLYVCNPITREYIKFFSPDGTKHYYDTYGFGVSKVTGQHKVVRVLHDCIHDPETNILLSIPNSDCQVYTLETGSWRAIAPGAPLKYYSLYGAFLNGNLHWLAGDLKGSFFISSLDLETELFTTFPAPCPPPENRSSLDRMMDLVGCLGVGLVALGGCLCLCDNTSDNEFVIWFMKEYGVEKSWSKLFGISKIPNLAHDYHPLYPIKIFKDGNILMHRCGFDLFYYCHKTKTQKTYLFRKKRIGSFDAMLHTPTFISLKGIAKENVYSFCAYAL